MDELRMVRREDGALVLANDLGEEFRFAIDDVVAAEIRQLNKRPVSPSSVRPREIQAQLRAGKSRAEVAEMLELEEIDVERFEEPVRAEQRYMLDVARQVSVRTDPARVASDTAEEQQFGEVIAERLVTLGNTTYEWRSWKDETAGWLIGLSFDSRDGDHDAIWSLDHRKRVLTPLTPDATNLSKVGDVGDRLIPKLRAVESEQGERGDAGSFSENSFDPDALFAETGEHETLKTAAPTSDGVLFGAGEATVTDLNADDDADARNEDAEYERRREIDFHAVSTGSDDANDLSQTADLLDALRRRRSERAQANEGSGSDDAAADAANEAADDAAPVIHAVADGESSKQEESAPADPVTPARPTPAQPDSKRQDSKRPSAARNIWGASGVAAPLAGMEEEPAPAADDAKASKRGRSSIPSWDDILFGTRSDDDPA